MSEKRLSDIALNYTILGNYKNVYVTRKSAYFGKKKTKKKMYMYKYISKESFFKGKLRFRRVHLIFFASFTCRSEKQFSVFCSPFKALLDYISLKVFYHKYSLPGTFGQGMKS